jgi:(R)-2-hydroxyacyl-CoA dehydratese activating ATPase
MAIKSYDVADIISHQKLADLQTDASIIGVDIGSRQSKAVLIYQQKIYTVITASGVDSQETASYLIDKLIRAAGISKNDIKYVVGTGYGRVALDFDEFSTAVVTEITCHALGAHFLNAGTRTIIDIGGQDCKAIKIDPATGTVIEFVMNDKCAAGTGRFLEKTAEMLDYTLDELGTRVLESKKKLEISSQCVVFAESEIISLRARGESREDIAAGIHFAAARRVKNLVNRIGLDPELIFSGGVSNNQGMRYALEDLLKHPIKTTSLDTVYCGALGAALYAYRSYTNTLKKEIITEAV